VISGDTSSVCDTLVLCSSSVNGFTRPGEIADHFASQYQSLYSSVGKDAEELPNNHKDSDINAD